MTIKDRKYIIYLTTRRLILEGGGTILEFPLEQVESASATEGIAGQPGIRIAVHLKSGDIRDLVLTFLQEFSSRSGERDDWVSVLGGTGRFAPPAPERFSPPPPPPMQQPEFQGSIPPRSPAPAPAQTGQGSGLKFCPSCGSHLPSAPVKFCPSCGNTLPATGGAAPPVQETPPPVPQPPPMQQQPMQPPLMQQQPMQPPLMQQPDFPGNMPPPPPRQAAYDPLMGPQPGGFSPGPGPMAPPPFPGSEPRHKGRHKKKEKPAKLPVRKTQKQKSMKKAKPKRRDSYYDSHYSGGGIDPLYADASTPGKKIIGFVLHPRDTFSACRYDSAGDALRYFLFINVIFAVATVAWIFLLAGSAEASLYPRLAEIYNGGTEAFIMTVIELYVYGLVSVGVAGIMLHFGLLLSTGGSDLKESFRTTFYAGTAYGIAGLIPIVGIIIGPLWLLLLETIGVSETKNLSTGSAAIPVIISVVLVAVVLYVLHIMEIMTFGLMRIVI